MGKVLVLGGARGSSLSADMIRALIGEAKVITPVVDNSFRGGSRGKGGKVKYRRG